MLWGLALIIFILWFGTCFFGWLGLVVSVIVIFAFLFGGKIKKEKTFFEEILSIFTRKK